MNPRVAPLYEQLELNTRLLINTLDGVDDETARKRPGDGTNSMVFIALHLLDARAYLARYIGARYEHPFKELESVGSIDEMARFPELEAVRASWREVAELLAGALPELADTEIDRESSQEFPVQDRTVLGGIAFLLQHESFHIGQLAVLRKLLGLGPMSYV